MIARTLTVGRGAAHTVQLVCKVSTRYGPQGQRAVELELVFQGSTRVYMCMLCSVYNITTVVSGQALCYGCVEEVR
jgi:hypothetical protein